MRQTFASFAGLFYYYLLVKNQVRSMKTLLPKKDEVQIPMNALAMQSRIEEKLCFIGDCEQFFFKQLKGWERKLIDLYYTKSEYSYEDLAQWFRRHNRDGFPKELQHREKIQKHFKRIKTFGEGYFRGKGYM